MRTVKQDFWQEFKCIADKCPATCCSGWQIMIDDDSLDKYDLLEEPLRTAICDNVDFEEGCFLQRENRDCAFLNSHGLCNMIIDGGEELLCDTCRLYPRHVEEYPDLREWSISMSCPVVAEMMLNRTTPMQYITADDDEADPLEEEFEDFDYLLLEKLLDSRNVMYDILRDSSLDFEKKAGLVLELSKRLQENFDTGEYFLMDDEIADFAKPDFRATLAGELKFSLENMVRKDSKVLNDLEVLDEKWTNLKKNLKFYKPVQKGYIEGIDATGQETVLANILEAMLYTYYPGAVYNGMIYAYTKMCIFTVAVVDAIGATLAVARAGKITKEKYAEVLYRFCRETEHSDDNIGVLLEYFDL